MTESWNPAQYERFRAERTAPFYDLLALVKKVEHARVVDLGCGTGELTRVLHQTLGASETLGIDSSIAMLQKSKQHSLPGLSFETARIEDYRPRAPLDLVFSNAALQWIDDHARLFERLTAMLARGGQLAVQMPANDDHPSHVVARELGAREPFASALGQAPRVSPVLPPERYSLLLEELGYEVETVRLYVYLHRLQKTSDLVEWVKGTLLTWYEAQLGPELYARFIELYSERLFEALGVGADAPYRFAFKRILLWAKR